MGAVLFHVLILPFKTTKIVVPSKFDMPTFHFEGDLQFPSATPCRWQCSDQEALTAIRMSDMKFMHIQ